MRPGAGAGPKRKRPRPAGDVPDVAPGVPGVSASDDALDVDDQGPPSVVSFSALPVHLGLHCEGQRCGQVLSVAVCANFF